MNINGLERIYIKDILKMINRKDIRSARMWCEKNEVDIYSDISGKYVIESEFEYAYSKPVIVRYKQKYGDKWQLFYERSKKGNLYLSYEEEMKLEAKNRYQPKSKLSRDILGSKK